MEMTLEELFIKLGKKRENISIIFGYFPASSMAELYHTHGLHLVDMIPTIKDANLKIDWSGFRAEMLSTGMKESSIQAMIEEAKHFASFLK